jgi:hypothetical protein
MSSTWTWTSSLLCDVTSRCCKRRPIRFSHNPSVCALHGVSWVVSSDMKGQSLQHAIEWYSFWLSIFSFVSVWATFVMHDTGPGRQSFSQSDCQIYIENYMVIISGATGTCSFSTLRWHYIFAGRVRSFCTLPIVQYSKKRTYHFGSRISFSP